MWFPADTTGTNDIPTFNSNGTRNPHGTNGTSGGSGGTYQGSNGTHPGSNGTHHGPNGTHVNGTNGNFNGTHPGFNSTDGTNGTDPKGPSLCIQQSTPACAQTDTATGTTCDDLTGKWNITQKHFFLLNGDVNRNCTNLTAGQTVRFFLFFFAIPLGRNFLFWLFVCQLTRVFAISTALGSLGVVLATPPIPQELGVSIELAARRLPAPMARKK
jgi:hypothetical protein